MAAARKVPNSPIEPFTHRPYRRHTKCLFAHTDHHIVAIQADLLNTGLCGGEQNGACGDTPTALPTDPRTDTVIRQGSRHQFRQQELGTLP